MRSLKQWVALATTAPLLQHAQSQQLSTADRFQIFSEMNLHQAYIDLEGTCDDAKLYSSLYWPDASFRVIDEKSNRNLTVSNTIVISESKLLV